jgi:hypothetical protein
MREWNDRWLPDIENRIKAYDNIIEPIRKEESADNSKSIEEFAKRRCLLKMMDRMFHMVLRDSEIVYDDDKRAVILLYMAEDQVRDIFENQSFDVNMDRDKGWTLVKPYLFPFGTFATGRSSGRFCAASSASTWTYSV